MMARCAKGPSPSLPLRGVLLLYQLLDVFLYSSAMHDVFVDERKEQEEMEQPAGGLEIRLDDVIPVYLS